MTRDQIDDNSPPVVGAPVGGALDASEVHGAPVSGALCHYLLLLLGGSGSLVQVGLSRAVGGRGDPPARVGLSRAVGGRGDPPGSGDISRDDVLSVSGAPVG
jgi:hypothetical protein